MEARRAHLEFRVSLVDGWRPSGATLLVHSATPQRAGARFAVDVSGGRGWQRTSAVHAGDGWLEVPIPAAVTAAVLDGRPLEVRWRERKLRLDSRESVRFAPYLIVKQPDE